MIWTRAEALRSGERTLSAIVPGRSDSPNLPSASVRAFQRDQRAPLRSADTDAPSRARP